MRIWSLHPKYLDAKGIVALWREALLAKNVLENKTKGYRNHPQLLRFKQVEYPLNAINQYLAGVHKEAVARNYNFNSDKINWDFKPIKIPVNNKQIDYEFQHLLQKLKVRDLEKYKSITDIQIIETAELFYVTDGAIEDWEVVLD